MSSVFNQPLSQLSHSNRKRATHSAPSRRSFTKKTQKKQKKQNPNSPKQTNKKQKQILLHENTHFENKHGFIKVVSLSDSLVWMVFVFKFFLYLYTHSCSKLQTLMKKQKEEEEDINDAVQRGIKYGAVIRCVDFKHQKNF